MLTMRAPSEKLPFDGTLEQVRDGYKELQFDPQYSAYQVTSSLHAHILSVIALSSASLAEGGPARALHYRAVSHAMLDAKYLLHDCLGALAGSAAPGGGRPFRAIHSEQH